MYKTINVSWLVKFVEVASIFFIIHAVEVLWFWIWSLKEGLVLSTVRFCVFSWFILRLQWAQNELANAEHSCLDNSVCCRSLEYQNDSYQSKSVWSHVPTFSLCIQIIGTKTAYEMINMIYVSIRPSLLPSIHPSICLSVFHLSISKI